MTVVAVMAVWLILNLDNVVWRDWLFGFVLGGVLLEWFTEGKAHE